MQRKSHHEEMPLVKAETNGINTAVPAEQMLRPFWIGNESLIKQLGNQLPLPTHLKPNTFSIYDYFLTDSEARKKDINNGVEIAALFIYEGQLYYLNHPQVVDNLDQYPQYSWAYYLSSLKVQWVFISEKDLAEHFRFRQCVRLQDKAEVIIARLDRLDLECPRRDDFSAFRTKFKLPEHIKFSIEVDWHQLQTKIEAGIDNFNLLSYGTSEYLYKAASQHAANTKEYIESIGLISAILDIAACDQEARSYYPTFVHQRIVPIASLLPMSKVDTNDGNQNEFLKALKKIHADITTIHQERENKILLAKIQKDLFENFDENDLNGGGVTIIHSGKKKELSKGLAFVYIEIEKCMANKSTNDRITTSDMSHLTGIINQHLQNKLVVTYDESRFFNLGKRKEGTVKIYNTILESLKLYKDNSVPKPPRRSGLCC